MGLSIGEIWFEKYRVITRLGHGGSAEVFLVEHISLSAYRAVKRISKAERLHDFWLREARILKSLSHLSIPVIYDLEEDGSYSYIIMEYLKGISLKDYRMKHKMTEQEIGNIAIQVCRILRYLHSLESPLLYLDLKPENLMICGACVKLVDFGAALPKKETGNHSIIIGTRGYAAPELFERGRIDERSDIYSFGMLLFFLFTGEAPKREKKKIQNIDCLKGIQKEWKDIVNHCLKYMPGMRFSSAASLEEKLLAISGKKAEDMPSEDMPSEDRLSEKRSCRILRIIGTGHGTSHVCLMLAFLLANQGKTAAYREMKEHGVTESLFVWTERNKVERKSIPSFWHDIKKEQPLSCHGIRLFRGEEEWREGEQFDIEIQDYGRIDEETPQELFKMEHIVLITGVKCWELRELEQILTRFESFPLLCMNFVSGREFLSLARYYREYLCLQIPYQPDPFQKPSGQGKRFAERLWEEADYS